LNAPKPIHLLFSFALPEEIGTPGKFGLMLGKNATLSPWQTVNTGQRSMKHISETVAFNGKTKFNVSSNIKSYYTYFFFN
jgi:hypothetical protein